MRVSILGNKYFLGIVQQTIELLNTISMYLFIVDLVLYAIITVIGGIVVKQTSEHFKKILLIVTRMSI